MSFIKVKDLGYNQDNKPNARELTELRDMFETHFDQVLIDFENNCLRIQL